MRLSFSLAPFVVLGAVVAQQQPEFKLPPRPPMVTPDLKGPAQPQTAQPYTMVKPADPIGPALPTPGVAPGVPVSKPQVAAATAGISAQFADTDLCLVDQPGDGRTWVRGFNYKASFGTDGTVFAPLFANAQRHYPLHFGTPQVTVGGNPLRSAAANAAQTADRTITFARGDFQERYLLSGKGIEQQFVFDSLTTRGTMVLSVPLDSELAGQRAGNGLVFANEVGEVNYSQAVAIDAKGRRLALSTELRGGSIEITVPEAFMQTAAMPLVIDPLIGAATIDINVSGSAPPISPQFPDIAYDVTNDEYSVCFQLFLNATDTDCYVQRLNGAYALVGTAIVVDVSFDVWEKAKIANNNIANNHLIVAQVSVDGVSPFWVAGRTLAAGTGVMSSQFDIEKTGVTGHLTGDKLNPDVGGDPLLVGPTYYTVVWERAFSAADHDIHMKQVLANATLRTAAPITIENASADYDSNPSISKSDGASPASSQNWAIGFQRRFSAADEDIRGSIVSWDGVILQVAAANSFSVDFSGTKDQNVSPSSPTDVAGGSRYVLFAYDSQPNGGGQTDIVGTVFDVTGVARSGRTDLNVLEGATAAQQALPQKNPSCDSDGCRFIVAYDEFYNAGGTDQDVMMSLFSYQTGSPIGSLVLNEARQTAGYSTSIETNVEVTSTHSGGGGMTRYAGAWMDDNGTVNDKIEGRAYDGYRAASTIASRATGCGGLLITANNARLGDTMVLDLTNGLGIKGFLFGAPQVGAPIPACPGSGCLLGVANGTVLAGSPFNITLPCQLGGLVGLTFAAQGYDFGGGGSCIGAVRTSATLDITIQ